MIKKMNFTTSLLSCNSGVQFSENKDCMKYYSKANSSLNQYYLDNNTHHLDTILHIIDSIYDVCSDYKTRLTNLKLNVLVLLKDYEKGLKFVNSLDSADFSKPYQKKLYLFIFKAFDYETQCDTLKSKTSYEEVVKEVERYILKNPSDKEVLFELFLNKVKVIGKEKVIKEIDSIYVTKFDPHILAAIKETIINMPE